ncbi:hypothetical protein [Hymenobacter armeniacus]|uniref:Uncharacterized protein n=1 Tax=Hymenobacter armeniacus TaxID=2771358 RepID=A0ABR8JM90_9BACT|nr:hypothetical protein [Hymenobacter armeniacus]MBD2721117.1 hypothetical protein [Hymenobacter armeniacus]
MSLKFNLSTFTSLFPDATVSSDHVMYEVEDSNYRVYNPSLSGTTLTIKVDHIRGGATDDHAVLTLAFDGGTARLTNLQASWTTGNDGYQIPDVVVKVVDDTAELLGAIGAIETAGISEEAAQVAVAAFDGFCKLFNKLSPLIVGLSDDGGRFYTMAVVCHTVNRACSSMSVN